MRSHASNARRHSFARLRALALRLVPVVALVVVAAGGLVYPAAIDAQVATAPECTTPTPGPTRSVSRTAVAVEIGAVITARGEETGRRLAFGARRGGRVAVELPAESFVVGPFDDQLIYGFHRTESGSEVRSLSLDTGCDIRLALPAGIVRSALPEPSGAGLYVHAVTDDGERRDAGVTRIDLAGGGSAPALEPIVPEGEFGPIFSTQLAWAGHERLLVQSCGFRACQTRVADLATGEVATHATPHGMLVAVSSTELIAFAAEHDRPTQLLAVNLATGEVRTIAEEVFEAELVEGVDTTRLMIETPAGWQEVPQ